MSRDSNALPARVIELFRRKKDDVARVDAAIHACTNAGNSRIM